ncbi:MAG: hypothetical protein OEW00_00170 [candidate division Zixibacteria bacterium]|nr:hypothetical protein [candidate division Zixibacteria bacterium]
MSCSALKTTIFTIFLPLITTGAQLHQDRHLAPPPNVPKASYNIRATIDATNLAITGELDLDFRNASPDTLDEIWLQVPVNHDRPVSFPFETIANGPYCRIDSILYRGVPLKADEVDIDADLVKIALPQPLAPDERASFLISFESRMSPVTQSAQCTHLSGWYPLLSVYKNGKWYCNRDPSSVETVGEFADYNVLLRLDSAYTLAAAGRLLNDREHLGFLPKPAADTVFTDVANPDGQLSTEYRASPVIRDGRKTFVIRAASSPGFSLVIAPDLIRDRAYLGTRMVEVCYDAEVAPLWKGFVARTAAQVIRHLEQVIGKPPADTLTIVAGSPRYPVQQSRHMIIVPRDIKDQNTLAAALALELAAAWFTPTVLTRTGAIQADNRAHAVYAAAMILYKIYGRDGFDMVAKYHKRLPRFSYEGPGESAKNTAAFQTNYSLLPLQLYMLRFVIGEKDLWRSLKKLASDFRYAYPNESDLPRVVYETTGADLGWFFEQWQSAEFAFDLGIDRVEARVVGPEHLLWYEVVNGGSALLPVEVGFVLSTADTVYDTLSYDDLNRGPSPVEFTALLPSRPRAVILDPNHYSPDNDRSNNYRFLRPQRFRYAPPRGVFPGIEQMEKRK